MIFAIPLPRGKQSKALTPSPLPLYSDIVRLTMTERYTHPSDSHKVAAIEKNGQIGRDLSGKCQAGELENRHSDRILWTVISKKICIVFDPT